MNNYLCPKHRQWLLSNPLSAIQHWHMAIHNARSSVRVNELSRANIYYGNAFDLADLLLDIDIDRLQATTRFALSAVELAFSLNCSGKNFKWIKKIADGRLKGEIKSHEVNQLIQSLDKIPLQQSTNKPYCKDHPIRIVKVS